MFTNLRIFTIAFSTVLSLLVVLFSFVLKNTFLSHHIAKAFEYPLESVITNYNTFVWDRYYPVLGYIKGLPETEWETYPQYTSFLEMTKQFFTIDKVLESSITIDNGVSIYDSKKNIDFKIEHTFLSSFYADFMHTDYNSFSSKIVNISYNDAGKSVYKKALQVVIPVHVSSTAKNLNISAPNVVGKINIYFDLSHFVERFNYLQFFLVSGFLLIIIAFNVTIFLFSKKVEELIANQQEASSELTQAKALAESESKAKSQFLANVSHELRTPLNAIIGFSEIISSESMGPLNNNQYKEFINDIHASGVHLLSLINDILDYSKAEENKMSIVMEPIDLTKVIKLCLRMLMPKAEIAQVILKDTVPSEHIIITADQKRTKQVFLNLITNSIKFTPEGGYVELSIHKNLNKNIISIQIKDNGVGMAAQDLAKALSPFGQIESKLSSRFEGTGLGLPLTKKLIEMMHGQFEIQSEQNVGTTITITFPYQHNEIEPDQHIITHPTQ